MSYVAMRNSAPRTIEYLSHLYSSISVVCHLHPLFLLQKKIIRIMTFSPYLAHTEILFINHEILPLDKLTFNRIAIMMYKYNNDMLPSVMLELYKKNNEIHTYDTRNKDLFRIDRGQKGLNIYLNNYSNIY